MSLEKLMKMIKLRGCKCVFEFSHCMDQAYFDFKELRRKARTIQILKCVHCGKIKEKKY